MRNILGDDDVAFRPLIRTRDERKGVERSGDGLTDREASTRVWSKYQTPPPPPPLSLSLTFSLARNVE